MKPDDLIAVPTLDPGVIIDTRYCYAVCRILRPHHCTGCHS